MEQLQGNLIGSPPITGYPDSDDIWGLMISENDICLGFLTSHQAKRDFSVTRKMEEKKGGRPQSLQIEGKLLEILLNVWSCFNPRGQIISLHAIGCVAWLVKSH